MRSAEKKKELRTVLENISDGVLFIDNDGAIRVYNKALSEMFSINEDLTGVRIFLLPMENALRQGIFRAEKGFPGPYCWERSQCPGDLDCPGKKNDFCRCWLFRTCGSAVSGNKSCFECRQYESVKRFLKKPKELEIGGKIISVLSSFIESGDKDEILEVIVFKDVTFEKLDAVCKLAGATAHELRQPLQIITSCVALLSEKMPDDITIKKSLILLKKAAIEWKVLSRKSII